MNKARTIGTILVVLIVLAPLAVSAQTEESTDYAVARLNYVRGEVLIERASDLGTEKGEINLPIVVGDKLKTMDGQAEVHFGKRNYLRIDALSEVEFIGLPSQDDLHVKVNVLSGHVYFRAGSMQEEKAVEIHTPDASFYVLEEGLYRLDVGYGDTTEAFVHEGSLEAAAEEGSVVVNAGEKIIAADGSVDSGPESFYAARDAFDLWNRGRDDLLARKSTTSRLPSDISEYEEELEGNGTWTYEQPYGNVWVPSVSDPDWRPYYYGRWDWYPLFGWTWISSEPWGWCTSHYGRWNWASGHGWYWIPSRHWGPAWVHWYWDNDYIGWCPLSYYNYPGVLIGDRFYDRYRDSHYPLHSRALSFIHRDQLQSRDVSRHMLRSSELGSLRDINLRAQQPDIRPIGGRTGSASPNGIKSGAGIVSKGSLRSRSTALSSGTRSLSSNGRSVSSSGGIVRNTKMYPSRGTGSTLRRPSGISADRRTGIAGSSLRSKGTSISSTRGIKTYAPGSSTRSITGKRQILGKIGSSGSARAYPSRITRKNSVSSPSSRSMSGGIMGGRSAIREYPSGISGRTLTGRSNSSTPRSFSGSRSRYSAPTSKFRSSYSAPSYSPRSYSGGSVRSYSGSSSRYSAPSYSPRSYSGGSARSYSGPSSRSMGGSSSGSRSSYSAPSRSSGGSHSRSSSSSHSGGVRKK
jgi:hypothetical protein